MSVFDNSVKIGVRVQDPGTDRSLPPGGSLAYPAITTPAGLAGTTGIDCKLVHGDRWQQIDQNLTEEVGQNVMTTIMGNETRTVTGNQELTTVGNLTSTIVGTELLTNVGAQNHTRVAPRTEIHAGSKQQEEPGSFFRVVGEYILNHIFAYTLSASRVVILGNTNEVVGYRLQVVMNDLKTAAMKNSSQFLIRNEAGSLRNTLSALKNHVTGNAGWIRMAEEDVGPRVQAPPESLPGIE